MITRRPDLLQRKGQRPRIKGAIVTVNWRGGIPHGRPTWDTTRSTTGNQGPSGMTQMHRDQTKLACIALVICDLPGCPSSSCCSLWLLCTFRSADMASSAKSRPPKRPPTQCAACGRDVRGGGGVGFLATWKLQAWRFQSRPPNRGEAGIHHVLLDLTYYVGDCVQAPCTRAQAIALRMGAFRYLRHLLPCLHFRPRLTLCGR